MSRSRTGVRAPEEEPGYLDERAQRLDGVRSQQLPPFDDGTPDGFWRHLGELYGSGTRIDL